MYVKCSEHLSGKLKYGFFLVILLTVHINLNAQLYNVADKDLQFSIGYGTPWVFREGYATVLPPLGIALDIGVSNKLGPGVISAGAVFGATTYNDEIYDIAWPTEYGRKGTLLAIGLRGTYHYQFSEMFDTYTYLHLGTGFENWKAYGDLPSDTDLDVSSKVRFVPGIGAGAKYYFSTNLFAVVEIGYGINFISGGIGIRL